MTAISEVLLLITMFSRINAVSIWEQLNHINEAQKSSQLIYDDKPSRRVFEFNRYEGGGTILGVPSRPSHLPAAEHMLPGHMLLRPALGMLKSAVKFPHRENENGVGVYGNPNNLGIKYDGRNERLLYSGFRRMPRNNNLTSRTQHHLGDYEGIDAEIVESTKKATDLEGDEIWSAKIPKEKLWFWNSTDMFDHLNINPNAIEYSEFLPTTVTGKPKLWSFYHKEDQWQTAESSLIASG